MHVHDHERRNRIGLPEAVLCSSKTTAQLDGIVETLASETTAPVLFTRLSADQYGQLAPGSRERLDHDARSETATLHGTWPRREGVSVAVVAAGTSDEKVAREASETLRFHGIEPNVIGDVGVAGLWRLEQRLPEILEADAVIAVAGMDAALVSVLGGLVAAPLVAAPTSVGYGVAAAGTVALHSSLASCAQGVAVVNVDNGFGAACVVLRMVGLIERRESA